MQSWFAGGASLLLLQFFLLTTTHGPCEASASVDSFARADVIFTVAGNEHIADGVFASYVDYSDFEGNALVAIANYDSQGEHGVGYGCQQNKYEGANEETVAVAMRGGCKFSEMTEAAAAAGAGALIIINNVDSDKLLKPEGEYSSRLPDIPTVAISLEDGLLLLNATTNQDDVFVEISVTADPLPPFIQWSQVFINNAIFFAAAMMLTITVTLIMLGIRKCTHDASALEVQRQEQDRVQSILDSIPSVAFSKALLRQQQGGTSHGDEQETPANGHKSNVATMISDVNNGDDDDDCDGDESGSQNKPPAHDTHDETATGLHGDSSHEQCAVCIQDYEDGEWVRELPCGHLFHTTCVDPWLLEKHTCPLCKRSLLADNNV